MLPPLLPKPRKSRVQARLRRRASAVTERTMRVLGVSRDQRLARPQRRVLKSEGLN